MIYVRTIEKNNWHIHRVNGGQQIASRHFLHSDSTEGSTLRILYVHTHLYVLSHAACCAGCHHSTATWAGSSSIDHASIRYTDNWRWSFERKLQELKIKLRQQHQLLFSQLLFAHGQSWEMQLQHVLFIIAATCFASSTADASYSSLCDSVRMHATAFTRLSALSPKYDAVIWVTVLHIHCSLDVNVISASQSDHLENVLKPSPKIKILTMASLALVYFGNAAFMRNQMLITWQISFPSFGVSLILDEAILASHLNLSPSHWFLLKAFCRIIDDSVKEITSLKALVEDGACIPQLGQKADQICNTVSIWHKIRHRFSLFCNFLTSEWTNTILFYGKYYHD